METRPLHVRSETLVNHQTAKNAAQPDDKTIALSINPESNAPLKTEAEALTLSNESIKLAASERLNKADFNQPITNEVEARQIVNDLLEQFQNNPLQALKAQSDILTGHVKTLLG